MSKNNKKNKYRPFSINRLKKEWPFSLELADDIFSLNQYAPYSSLRDFFIYTDITIILEKEAESDSEAESGSLEFRTDLSYSEKNELIGQMGVWEISKYPGFFITNNKVLYKETIKSKVENSTKEELINKIYTLDHIPYENFIYEGTKFFINNFLQRSGVNYNAAVSQIVSLSIIWEPVFNYLLFTKLSSSMKKMLENQNYRKSYEKQILLTFEDQFKRIKPNSTRLNKIILKRSVFEERFLNILLFSEIPENKSKVLVNNFFLTSCLDEIISFYQELLSQF